MKRHLLKRMDAQELKSSVQLSREEELLVEDRHLEMEFASLDRVFAPMEP